MSRRFRVLVTILLSLVAVASCGDTEEGPSAGTGDPTTSESTTPPTKPDEVELPSLLPTHGHSPEDGYPLADLTGTLVLNGPCLEATLWDSDDTALILWPLDYRLAQIDNRLVVVDGAGAEVAAVGDRVRIGGGFVSPTEFAHELAGDTLPEECAAATDYWLAAPHVEVLEPTG